jgi:hypothetical protein
MQAPARTKHNHKTPQPRIVQLSKRRQSGKGPVGDGADLVAVQPPAPANHGMSKRSRAHRSPKITHTPQIPKPLTHQSHLPYAHSPASVIRPCIVCSSHAFADAFPVPNAHRQGRKQKPKQVLLQQPCMWSITLGPQGLPQQINEKQHKVVLSKSHIVGGLADSRNTQHLSACWHLLPGL